MFGKDFRIQDIENFDLDDYQSLTERLSRIQKTELEDELSSFSAFFCYYYGIMVSAKARMDQASAAYKTQLASEKVRYRKDGNPMGMCEALALDTPVITELHEELMKRELVYSLLKGVCNTLENKKDMLIQLSANQRQEYKLHQ